MTTLQHPVLGIDIGGTNMRFALVDGALHLRAYEQLSTQAVFAHGAQPTQKLAQQIRAYCARHLQGEAPAAVSIGFPSTINRARTVDGGGKADGNCRGRLALQMARAVGANLLCQLLCGLRPVCKHGLRAELFVRAQVKRPVHKGKAHIGAPDVDAEHRVL